MPFYAPVQHAVPLATVQTLYLGNDLSGTIPEGWQLPDSLQVCACGTSFVPLLLMCSHDRAAGS